MISDRAEPIEAVKVAGGASGPPQGQQGTGQHGTHGHHPEHPPLPPWVVFTFFGVVIGSQIGLYVWKKRHARSYQNATLAALWLIPACISAWSGYVRFLLVWAAFTCLTGYLVRLAVAKPLDVKTPRLVYRWFHTVYLGNYLLGAGGYALALLQGLLGPAAGVPEAVAEVAIMAVFYGLYFGVLGRDAAEMCADRMSQSLGVRRVRAALGCSLSLCGSSGSSGSSAARQCHGGRVLALRI